MSTIDPAALPNPHPSVRFVNAINGQDLISCYPTVAAALDAMTTERPFNNTRAEMCNCTSDHDPGAVAKAARELAEHTADCVACEANRRRPWYSPSGICLRKAELAGAWRRALREAGQEADHGDRR